MLAEQALLIEWDDGHRSRYTAAELRWACPCAECRGEMGSPGRLDAADRLDPADLELAGAGLVGRYAVQLEFASGHSTGIYTFRHLRAICPCAECRDSRRLPPASGGGPGGDA